MKRREFVTLLGAAAAAWPLPARAQPARKIPRIGVLWHAGSAEEEGSNFKALVKGFTDLGYIEGRMIILEHRFPNEVPDRFRDRKSTRLNSSHSQISYAVFCLKKKNLPPSLAAIASCLTCASRRIARCTPLLPNAPSNRHWRTYRTT